jgi:hypothetical protein
MFPFAGEFQYAHAGSSSLFKVRSTIMLLITASCAYATTVIKVVYMCRHGKD